MRQPIKWTEGQLFLTESPNGRATAAGIVSTAALVRSYSTSTRHPVTEPSPSAGRPKTRLVLVGVFGLIALAGVATAVYLQYVAANVPRSYAPGPRPEINAPFIKTPDRVVEEMVKLAELTEDDLVYDLGCGDGRLVVTASVRSGCRGVGFDIDPERVAEANENAKLAGVDDRVEIVEQDVFTVDLSEADVCLTYLLPWMMSKLVPQFEQMRPGCRIVAHDFWIEGVVPEEIVEMTNEEKGPTRLYLYVTPLRFDPAMEKGKPPTLTESPKKHS